MPVQIVPISPEDIPGAARCIQRAFKDDPYFKWVFDPATYQPNRNISSLTLRCQWGINNALFYIAKDTESTPPNDILGVSMWLPPKAPSEPESWASVLASYLLWFKQGLLNTRHLGRGGLIYRRYQIWKRSQAEAQNEIWTDPEGYYFCNIVVVDPKWQGKGLGRKLMAVVTNHADRDKRKCYLESSRREPNVEIYEKMGFRVARRMTCEDGVEKCDLYCMVRDPLSGRENEQSDVSPEPAVEI